ncbi:AAA family ATPase, partial [Aliarcobacter butzleri]
MITRVYLKNCLSFDEVDLEFKSGLNIFTGPSGAGKSILMQEILS